MNGLRLPEHSHCRFCGDPVPFGQEFCDDDCKREYDRREAKDKQKDILIAVGAGAVIVVILVAGLLF
ncbi:MAG: DUF2116 family Zn-ribbon domain-containing protein [Candidatus Methanomethylophilaceae archaeon]|nr:DUF2116 family Zn-ribbon domain-containing protein [Candidatus Methanomethylophilaceae archaeon]